jgi:hypothetical protein
MNWSDAFLLQAGIPLKTKKNPGGIHTEQEVYQFIAVAFMCVGKSSFLCSG